MVTNVRYSWIFVAFLHRILEGNLNANIYPAAKYVTPYLTLKEVVVS